MRRMLCAAPLALCACIGSMVRAPKQIPADGVVNCTDTIEVPVAASITAVLSAGGLVYALAHIDGAAQNGGVFWVPLLGILGFESLFAAGLGHSYVLECRKAKERGAALAHDNEARAQARAAAQTLWKRAAIAARADDCATVRRLDALVRELDIEFRDVVFARDVGIARCLISSSSALSPTR